jgi:hypothetical protein
MLKIERAEQGEFGVGSIITERGKSPRIYIVTYRALDVDQRYGLACLPSGTEVANRFASLADLTAFMRGGGFYETNATLTIH